MKAKGFGSYVHADEWPH